MQPHYITKLILTPTVFSDASKPCEELKELLIKQNTKGRDGLTLPGAWKLCASENHENSEGFTGSKNPS